MNLKDEFIVAIDFGLKRIGLAICSRGVTFAIPSKQIEAGKNDTETVKIILGTYKESIDRFVLGFPTFLDGKESTMTQRVKEFGKVLESLTQKPIHLVDERLTSESSENLLKESGVKQKDLLGCKDSMSALLILKDFLSASGL